MSKKKAIKFLHVKLNAFDNVAITVVDVCMAGSALHDYCAEHSQS